MKDPGTGTAVKVINQHDKGAAGVINVIPKLYAWSSCIRPDEPIEEALKGIKKSQFLSVLKGREEVLNINASCREGFNNLPQPFLQVKSSDQFFYFRLTPRKEAIRLHGFERLFNQGSQNGFLFGVLPCLKPDRLADAEGGLPLIPFQPLHDGLHERGFAGSPGAINADD